MPRGHGHYEQDNLKPDAQRGHIDARCGFTICGTPQHVFGSREASIR